MGTTTLNSNSHTVQRPAIKLFAGLDIWLIIIGLILVVYGLVILYSASMPVAFYAEKPTTPMYYAARQAQWAALGIVAAFIVSLINYPGLKKLVLPALFLIWGALILVIIIGSARHGSVRHFLNGSIQPSELLKVIYILYLAFWLKSKQEDLKRITIWIIPAGIILGFTCFLLFLEPDLSAMITIGLISFVLYFLADIDWKQIIFIFVVAVLSVMLLIQFSDTGLDRWEKYRSGVEAPENSINQVKRAIESIVDGGFFGVGIGQGIVKFTGLEVGQSDTIFTVIAEELGLLGCFFTIGLFLLLLWRGLKIALASEDMTGRLIAAGMSIWIVMEAFINIAGLFNMMPVGGNTLPFFSLGGSSLVSVLIGIGFILNVARNNQKQKGSERNTYSAVVDMRWRDRRRSISGARRPTTARR
jgi:cell division protein FtsW